MIKRSKQRQLRVLLPYVSLPSFIRADIDTLRLKYSVRLTNCSTIVKILEGLRLVFWADCVFCWFGSLRFIPFAVMARVLGKKVIIIAGGYDVANVPEIGYGNMRGFFTRRLGRFLFSTAHAVACFSRSSLDEARVHANMGPEN